ncbi:Crp/Fnr family transcriptional regulator [Croceivirga thetidis]|uniref:Crp/Fnr family transcriptional regulator n=1 Tax=Croceivirga thetidis TaxID=2721623 RepID=A0ABX1GR89_9FLAO|nr:Crp/Fnr family transcriptional regulator [Croceivirga thetidis]NKI32462.1 Crp/Fnr family transcriptional regulator [Croceivirga thetidis]
MMREYFNGFGKLSEANMDFLLSHCEVKTLKKGDKLIHAHQKVDSIYFFERGYLHYFTYNDLGERVTLKVVSPNYCWTVLESFFHQMQTLNECQALTDVRYCEMTRADFMAIKEKNQELSNFIQTITEQILSSKVVEANNISKMSVEERYVDLVQNYPEMVQEVPVGIIASYIGTSRETLHRIRRKLTAA